jgi:ribosomal protein L16/L10AE
MLHGCVLCITESVVRNSTAKGDFKMFIVVAEYKYSTPSVFARQTIEEAREWAAHIITRSATRATVYEHHPLNTNPGTFEEIENRVPVTVVSSLD